MALKAVKAKSCQDLVQKTNAALTKVDPKNQKSMDEVAKYLEAMKIVLYGQGNAEPNPDQLVQIAQEAYSSKLLLLMIEKLELVDFEAKKDIVQIFNKLLRREYGQRNPTVDHIVANPSLMEALVRGYEKPQVNALSCGLMLRECIKRDQLAKIILKDDKLFDLFFDYVQMSTFDVAADAFTSFKELLTSHKILCAEVLESNYERVMSNYDKLLKSDNYVTRRQSLKLLGELLLDRANFTIMTRYIGDPENLKMMMNMLRDKSKNIQFEAFHVFKVFVANPSKPKEILDILLKNKTKLIEFLSKFHESRDEEQFAEEKSYLIKQIKELS